MPSPPPPPTNAIVSPQVSDDGKTLLIVNTASGELFTVDAESGEATLVDLGGVLVHGDGLVRSSVVPLQASRCRVGYVLDIQQLLRTWFWGRREICEVKGAIQRGALILRYKVVRVL